MYSLYSVYSVYSVQRERVCKVQMCVNSTITCRFPIYYYMTFSYISDYMTFSYISERNIK